MQKPLLNPPIRAICTTSDGAVSDKPVFIIGAYYDADYDSESGDSYRWYRKYSDGTIVQGAYREDMVKDAVWTVPFVIPFTTTNVDIQITPVLNGKPSSIQGGMAVAAITTANFNIHGDTNIDKTEGYYWEATGK